MATYRGDMAYIRVQYHVRHLCMYVYVCACVCLKSKISDGNTNACKMKKPHDFSSTTARQMRTKLKGGTNFIPRSSANICTDAKILTHRVSHQQRYQMSIWLQGRTLL